MQRSAVSVRLPSGWCALFFAVAAIVLLNAGSGQAQPPNVCTLTDAGGTTFNITKAEAVRQRDGQSRVVDDRHQGGRRYVSDVGGSSDGSDIRPTDDELDSAELSESRPCQHQHVLLGDAVRRQQSP